MGMQNGRTSIKWNTAASSFESANLFQGIYLKDKMAKTQSDLCTKLLIFNTVCNNKRLERAQMFFSSLNQGIYTMEHCAAVTKKWEL